MSLMLMLGFDEGDGLERLASRGPLLGRKQSLRFAVALAGSESCA